MTESEIPDLARNPENIVIENGTLDPVTIKEDTIIESETLDPAASMKDKKEEQKINTTNLMIENTEINPENQYIQPCKSRIQTLHANRVTMLNQIKRMPS